MTDVDITTAWYELPDWFKNNAWVAKNVNTKFVNRLFKIAVRLKMDRELKSPEDEPLEATIRIETYFLPSESIEHTQIGYSLLLEEATKLMDDDVIQANLIIAEFKKEFSEYLPILTRRTFQ